MRLDSTCNQVYVVALNEARIQNHEYITPEHYLYSALLFDLGRDTIEKSGGDINSIKKDLQDFFEQHIPKRVTENPVDSYSFVQMFELASAQAHYSGKDMVNLGNIIAAMFNLQESYAVYIMLKNGVNRLTLLRVISHSVDYNTPLEQESDTTPVKSRDKDFLKTFTINLTEKARNNRLDPLIGREDILERTIQVLSRRIKNNPVHVGDPGVGKTAIVEGLAQMIVSGNVPKLLKNSIIFYIDMGLVVAGTRYRGDFEERLIKILELITKECKPIVYLDEIHTVVGAGSVSGGNIDAGSILKPFLIKSDIKFIGSTTFEEYKKYFDKDGALSRRFQRIDINEPSCEDSIKILQGVKNRYEEYHNVIYTDEIIKLICELSSKYIQDRYLPDKAIDVMDESGAYIRMYDNKGYKKVVTTKVVELTIARTAKIPANSISGNEIEKLKNLEKNIKKQVFGQNEAVERVVNAIKASRSGLNDIEKPVASLLFVGPTGVGKTEIAKQLSKHLGIVLQRFDMSEYQEKHSVARLIGSPPGYVGFEDGGLLTEAIRKTPYCVLLLDEIEKAHTDIYNILLQIMDYGKLTDNIGKKADFRNVILILTSNAGAMEINKRIIGFDGQTASTDTMVKELEKIFSPEFRNRLDGIIKFRSVDKQMAEKIALKAINQLGARLKNKKITLNPTKRLIEHIASKGLSQIYGAREIIRIVENDIKRLLIDDVLFGKLADGGSVSADYKNEKIVIRARNSKKT